MSTKRITALLLAVVVVALAVAAPAAAEGDPMEAYDRVANLKRDISILNLLNGLHLTDEQQLTVLEEARAALTLKERYLESKSRLLRKTEDSFAELKRELLDLSAPPSREVALTAKRNNTEIKRLHESYVRELARMEKRVAQILTDGQKEILVDFKPCLIPPKNLDNPTRAGQAHDYSGSEKLLTRSRSWSDEVYERRVEFYMDKHIAKIEEDEGPMSDEEEMAERGRVRKIVEEAQALSDVEFELSKAELARRIDPHKDKKEPSLMSRGKRSGQIRRFLLSDRAVPLLEERVTMAGAPSYLAATDLNSIIPAENCRDACAPK